MEFDYEQYQFKKINGLTVLEVYETDLSSFQSDGKVGFFTNKSRNISRVLFNLNFSKLLPFSISFKIENYSVGRTGFKVIWGKSEQDYDLIKIDCIPVTESYREGKQVSPWGDRGFYGIIPIFFDTCSVKNKIEMFCDGEKIYFLVNSTPLEKGVLDVRPLNMIGFEVDGEIKLKFSDFEINTNLPQSRWDSLNINRFNKFAKPDIVDTDSIKNSINGEHEEFMDFNYDRYGMHDNGDGTVSRLGEGKIDYREAQQLRKQDDAEDGIVSDD